ncbi:MAG: hypothetical protein PVH19_08375, partial [Planctomycetia bacterium]
PPNIERGKQCLKKPFFDQDQFLGGKGSQKRKWMDKTHIPAAKMQRKNKFDKKLVNFFRVFGVFQNSLRNRTIRFSGKVEVRLTRSW